MRERRSFGRPSRRRVLATLAGFASAGAVADFASGRSDSAGARGRGDERRGRPGGRRGRVAGAPTLEPLGDIGFRGAAEAVVDDDGTTVYCSLVDGFGVVDASDPANPTVLYEERELTHEGRGQMRFVMDVKVSDDRLLVSGPNRYADTLSGFFLYDVSDPADPERVAFHETRFGPHNAFIDGEFVYLTGTYEVGEPIVIYDVSEDDPEEVARWAASDADDAWWSVSKLYRQAHDVYVQDDVLYVAYWDAGTWLVDVSDPANPTAMTQLGGHDPAYLESIELLATEFEELPGNSHYAQPNADGSAVFVGKEAMEQPRTARDGGPGGVELWDVSGSEPSVRTVLAPPEAGAASDFEETGWTAHNFGVDGDRLYTSWHGGGVRVYDVADLASPRLLGEWRAPETTWFWTAKPLDSGFVATSYLNPENPVGEQRRGVGARVFVFPEPDGENAVLARTMERRPFPDPGDDPAAATTPVTTPPKPVRIGRRLPPVEPAEPPGPAPAADAIDSGATSGAAESGPPTGAFRRPVDVPRLSNPASGARTTRAGTPDDGGDDAEDVVLPVVGGAVALATGGLGLRWLRERRRDE